MNKQKLNVIWIMGTNFCGSTIGYLYSRNTNKKGLINVDRFRDIIYDCMNIIDKYNIKVGTMEQFFDEEK